MQTAFFTTLIATTLALVSAVPAAENHHSTRATAVAGAKINVDIPPNCKICDSFGLGCVAACIAGGPIDPICDICAGPSIAACLQVCPSQIVSQIQPVHKAWYGNES
jgi:TPP-dependent indolepyruvate ferredoxin oxidoreductase alpha subunit